MTSPAGPLTFRPGRAFPRYAQWQARAVAAVGLLVSLGLLAGTLGPLLLEGESTFRLLGETVTATREAPGPALAASALAVAFGALFVTPAVLMEREARKGPPEWSATEAGLVRRRGDEVRTLPWSRFQRVWAGRASRTRGHVYLWSGGPVAFTLMWLRAEEGRVWTFSRAVCLADVERPDEVAALLRARLSTRR